MSNPSMSRKISAIAVLAILMRGGSAISQIVPDETLGNERSRVNSFSSQTDVIDGGAVRGINLFHSFRDFNVEAGRGVYFISPTVDVQNILARVTGSNPSQILGLLGTASRNGGRLGVSNANLFLINPNGIVFGKDASLDVDRSFFATTANTVQLGNIGSFNASQPEASTLLAIHPSALLFNHLDNQPIILRSATLAVPEKQNLFLVGGDIILDGSILIARDGNIEMRGLRGKGAIGVSASTNKLELDFLASGPFSTVSVLNNSGISTLGTQGVGNLRIISQDLKIQDSVILSGIEEFRSDSTALSGNIEIFATGRIRIDNSLIENTSRALARDSSGAIRIAAGSIAVTNSQISTSIFDSLANASSINIDSRDSIIFDRSQITSALSSSFPSGSRAGEIKIFSTGSLFLVNGSQISSTASDRGIAGNIALLALKSVFLDNANIISQHNSDSSTRDTSRGGLNAVKGRGGDVEITAGESVVLINESLITASAFGFGDAGNVKITTLDWSNPSRVQGKVQIDGGGVLASLGSRKTYSEGNAGNIDIKTGFLEITNGGQLTTVTAGKGNSGTITLFGTDVISFEGGTGFTTLAASFVELGAEGKGGDININTGSLSVTKGAQLASDTRGTGDGGNINIVVRDNAIFDGEAPSKTFDFLGQTITAPPMPSIVRSGTSGGGKAGDITIAAKGVVTISNTATINSQAFPVGNAGNISIDARTLNLGDGTIESNVFDFLGRGNGGNIKLSAQRILLQGDSNIKTSTPDGNGGEITLSADSIVALDDTDILTSSKNGRGGNIILDSRAFFGQNYIPAPSGTDFLILDKNNRVDINASGTVSGVVTLPDTTFIQNSLNQLPQTAIDTNTLLANSCIVRNRQNGSFYITGTGGLPTNPGETSTYSTGTVRPVAVWKPGDSIVEPQGVYSLPNGQLIMSRECD
jgi:filamentous hemagglutinin family protein